MKLVKMLLLIAVTIASVAKAEDAFKIIHVKDLQDELATKKDQVHVYDANNETTRKKQGTIPGAVLLANYNKYDVAKTLPTDKSSELVFFCANTGCSASHDAAKRAITAGYGNVSVMADGIEGWKKAGLKTQTVN